jgi:hypothetical protein
MGKITFREAIEKKLPIYEVSRGGSISSREANPLHGGFWKKPLDATAWHLTDRGTIDIGWGYAVFANADDAAELATRIVTTKYNNSIEKIKKVTGQV